MSEKNLVDLEELEKSVNALEYYADETEAAVTNLIEKLEVVKKMTMLLIKQRDDELKNLKKK